jgi:hypothetical protein
VIKNLQTYWKPEWYARVYELAADGLAPSKIGKALGIPDHTWRRCWQALPAVRDAAKRGLERNKSRKEFDGMPQYVYRHLPPHLLETWEKLESVFDAERHPEKFVEAIMSGHGAAARKSLYLHALVCGNFDGHAAGRKVGVSQKEVQGWCVKDPAFAELIKSEVLEIKRDLVEGGVFRAIQRGSTPELLWAAKCLLKGRGYTTTREDGADKVAEALTAKVELEKYGTEELLALLEVVRAKNRQLPPRVIEGEVVDATPI